MRVVRSDYRNFPLVLLAALVLTGLLSGPAVAQFGRPTIVIENVTVRTMDGPDIEQGVLIIRGDSIVDLGPADQVEIPQRARRIDGGGAIVTPGLIDVHSSIGLTGGGSGGAVNRAFDAFDRYATNDIAQAWHHGVTAAYLPARGGGVSGIGAVVSLGVGADGRLGDVLEENAALCVSLGDGATPIARLRAFDGLRKQFKAAKEYRESLETYAEELEEYEKKIAERAEKAGEENKKEEEAEETGNGGQMQQPPARRGGPRGNQGNGNGDEIKKPREPGPNRNAEVLLRAIDGEITLRVVANRSDAILNAIDLAEEYNLRITIEGGAEAHLVADQLAEHGIGVILGSTAPAGPSPGTAPRRATDAPRRLADAGVSWSVGSGAGGSEQVRFVLLNAARACQAIDGADPLAAVTSQAADRLGINSIGRLRAGARADLVLWSADPLEPGARAQRVYVGGRQVYQEETSEETE